MAALGASSAEPTSSAHNSTNQPVRKSFSCILYAQRKLKCDRSPGGCLNCTRARIPCIYKAPLPPRRRKKGEQDVNATTRIRLYEEALRDLGVNLEDLIRQANTKDPDRPVLDAKSYVDRRMPDTPERHSSSVRGRHSCNRREQITVLGERLLKVFKTSFGTPMKFSTIRRMR
jgi:hypothetical protein